MRRKSLAAAICTLPFVNGLALTNFQEISSTLIPIPCALAYGSQIATCTVEDFNRGCSEQCKRALVQKASEVTDACVGLLVNSRSLLGIVQAGGIVQALCIQDRNGDVTTTRRTTTSIQTTRRPQTTTTQNPIQTTTQRTTSLAPPTTQTTLPPTTLQTSTFQLSSITTELIVAPTTILPTPNAGNGNPVSSSTTSAAPTTIPAAGDDDNGSGGGSPFDIVGSAAQLKRSSLISAVAVAGWAFILFGR